MRRLASLLTLGVLAALVSASPAAAAPEAPAWKLGMEAVPANFTPGESALYLLTATNVGAKPTVGKVTLTVTLPTGLEPLTMGADTSDPESSSPTCEPPSGQVLECETTEALHPGRRLSFGVGVKVTAAEGEESTTTASIEGGDAAEGASTAVSAPITSEAVPFDFIPGFSAPATNGDGSPTVLAGAHPYQMTVDLGFPTVHLSEEPELSGSGHPRDVRIELPRGLIGNPAATPVLCTEAELTTEEEPGCPQESVVGMIDLTTLVQGPGIETHPLYNMVAPPGAAAEFAFEAGGVGIFIHLIAHLRSENEYRAYTTTNDVLALAAHPLFSTRAQLWGDPSGAAHDQIRGCLPSKGCEVERQETPFLTMPGDCSGAPLPFEAFADSWEEPSPAFKERETAYESADLQGNPVSLKACGELEYEPKIEARPTTNVTDSPAGLDFDLRQPPEEPEEEPLAGRATAILKDATVTFPAGLSVNPSQAAGLGACSETQIGFKGESEGDLRFSEEPQGCPDAAKIGTLEAKSPLLAEYNAEHEAMRNPETGAAIPRPLHGSVYLAQPFANPFGSLVSVYFVIEDPQTGVVVKLAGEGELNPATGQLTTRVRQSPELPVEDFHVHLFGGDRAALISPPTCVSHTTTATLTPWSAPEAPSVEKLDSFTPVKPPGGGACPTTEAQMPNAPVLQAGSTDPRAGKYSPVLFKVRREDGSQRLARLEATLPRGLIGKLAGVAQCSQAAIEQAISREAPNRGAQELADPSCPASSQVGTVSVAAGAGPNPYRTSGRAYLAGPYKGAPFSFVIIAPAIAGPFDLGTVVNRVAVHLEPETALVRAVSDPIPQLIEGVPLDVRTVAMHVDRPGFALNPTSCDVKAFEGTATSSLGQVAPLSQRFQVGGCRSLPYKPKMKVRLFGPIHRGGHPRLRAIFTAKPGEANTAKVSFAFPKTEFLDQAHFRTICTRVQFAAKQCPAGSVYGHVKVLSPLVDYPLEGPAYLRSSSHELPDLVVALHGPAYQPIEIDAVGRVDSVNGGLRVRFEEVPDAPISKLIFSAQGAKKGLFQNSTNICTHALPANLKLTAQNGKTYDSRPPLRASCPKRQKGRRGSARR